MEKLQRTIKTLNKKIVSTSFGEKEKMFFTTDTAPETTISCFVGNWNRDWEVGTQIEFTQDQMKVVEVKDGRTYHNLSAPPEARFQGIARNEFDLIVARVQRLEEELLPEPEPKPEENAEKEEGEILVENLGF